MTLKNANKRLAYMNYEARRVTNLYQIKHFDWSWTDKRVVSDVELERAMLRIGYNIEAEQVLI